MTVLKLWHKELLALLTLPQIQFVSNSPVAEAEAALQSLGYKPLEAQKLLRRLKADYTESADIIRAALKSMMK